MDEEQEVSGRCFMKVAFFFTMGQVAPIKQEVWSMRKEYRYGMRLRGFSPGCQPMRGLVERVDDPTGKYYDILIYGRKLTDQELADYELDKLD